MVTVKLLFFPLMVVVGAGLAADWAVFAFEFRLDLEKGERGLKLLNIREGLKARSRKLFFGVLSSSVR